ncbi:regulatory protein YcgZ [Pantoea sp. Lij88]|uniref:regulatory protein YcgZ n=1 Tax=Pantoea sp. Lij88 TaxID=3028622 RepID=UPI0024BB0A10|nr:regulatory protein YcgZ [Pantoea sp. Lij88]WHQ73461.1 regulatory protein YcgZ [Pantoea sp. Lij88]
MPQNIYVSSMVNEIAAYFSRATLPSQLETLGAVAVEILRSGRNLNSKSICSRLLIRLEHASSPEEERHYHQLIALLFDRD